MGPFPNCVAVIHPNSAAQDSIRKALTDHGLSVQLLMTYSDWVETGDIPEQTLLFVRESGVWLFGQTTDQKLEIRNEARAALDRVMSS
jgi:hypothetical protein